MDFRISRNGNIKVPDLFQQSHQVGRVHIRLTAARRQVATQRNDMANSAIPVIFSNGTQLIAAGIDTGQMRGGFQTGTLFNTFDNAMGAVTFTGVSAVGHGDKLRLQAAQAIDGFPEGLLHFTGTRRKEFKGDVNLALHFRQALIQGFPLIGVKKAHTLPHQSHFIVCCVANFYTFRRPDVKMTEKGIRVNRKISVNSEEYSARMKLIHLFFAKTMIFQRLLLPFPGPSHLRATSPFPA